MIIDSQKHLFDIPEDVAYFNNAYMSPLMHSVVEAMQRGLQGKVQPWNYTSQDFFTYAEQARALAGKIYGTAADNIAIVPSASYGLQIAANTLPLKAGQNILVLEDQFPSNIYPWQKRAANEDAQLIILPTPEDDDWTARLLTAINDKTAIIAVPQTHWASGATLDLVRVREALDRVGGALALDLTQSLGAQPFDVAAIRPDFVVATTYKWLMGPYSQAFLYIDPKWQDAEPLEHNWMNRAGSELEWGIENIAETLQAKTDQIAEALSSNNIKPLSRSLRAPHYLGLRFAQGMPGGLMEKLVAQNIFVSIRGDALRVTPHLYTTDSDILRLIEALNTV